MADNRKMEVIGMTRGKVVRYPFSALKVLGALQIASGCVCAVIGFVELLLYLFLEQKGKFMQATGDNTHNLLDTLTMSSAPIWCSIWFSTSGATALCISRKNKKQIQFYRYVFQVLSILCATVFGPVCFGVSVVMAILNHSLSSAPYAWLLPLMAAFFGFNETVIAIVSASICCCCSAVEQTRVRVFLRDGRFAEGNVDKDVYKNGKRERNGIGNDSPAVISCNSLDRPSLSDLHPHYTDSYRKFRTFVLPGSASLT